MKQICLAKKITPARDPKECGGAIRYCTIDGGDDDDDDDDGGGGGCGVDDDEGGP